MTQPFTQLRGVSENASERKSRRGRRSLRRFRFFATYGERNFLLLATSQANSHRLAMHKRASIRSCTDVCFARRYFRRKRRTRRSLTSHLTGRMINYTVRRAPETRRIQNRLVAVCIIKHELVSAFDPPSSKRRRSTIDSNKRSDNLLKK